MLGFILLIFYAVKMANDEVSYSVIKADMTFNSLLLAP